ncbi:hypothetical protein F5B17DRAFT_281011 [Nemania serpens]|nr:hypothetical protein F5B17DRAFT_281011 [Nemania serpens]
MLLLCHSLCCSAVMTIYHRWLRNMVKRNCNYQCSGSVVDEELIRHPTSIHVQPDCPTPANVLFPWHSHSTYCLIWTPQRPA